MDWVHVDSAQSHNSKARMGGARLRFSGKAGTGVNSGTSLVDDWKNIKISYTNGAITTKVQDNSRALVYTGAGSSGTFTAPSKAGVRRTLTVFAGSYAGARIRAEAYMGETTLELSPQQNTQKTTMLYRYVFEYTGAESEEPLTVRFTLEDTATDPAWGNIGFYGAYITSEETIVPEPYVAFITPSLTGQEAVTAPASGRTRRNVTAALFDENGTQLEGRVVYAVKEPVDGVTVDENGILYVSSNLKESKMVTVVAANAENQETFAETQVEVIKDSTLQDTPASELDKDGWVLFYNEEFDNEPDPRKWSGYYLRNWTTDELSKGHYFVEDGNLILTAPPDLAQWCSQDANQRVSGIQTFERQHYLGAYGTVGGVRVNKYCEVLNKAHLPIEGLYSAGSDANTLYGDSYNFTLPGNSMGFAVNSGRMAGEAIAQYIADCQ